MQMYNSDTYIVVDDYLKASKLWQYCSFEGALNIAGDIDVSDNNNSASFKLKQKTTGQTGNDGTKDVKKVVPLKHLQFSENFRNTVH